eukprot:11893884-Ditylum_brightwellii.AAC.1
MGTSCVYVSSPNLDLSAPLGTPEDAYSGSEKSDMKRSRSSLVPDFLGDADDDADAASGSAFMLCPPSRVEPTVMDPRGLLGDMLLLLAVSGLARFVGGM